MIIQSMVHYRCIGAYSSCCALSCVWIYGYSLNEDLSKVDNIPFYESKQDVFPVLSLCFKDPFSDEKLKYKNFIDF